MPAENKVKRAVGIATPDQRGGSAYATDAGEVEQLAPVFRAPTARCQSFASRCGNAGAKAPNHLVDIRRLCRHGHVAAYCSAERVASIYSSGSRVDAKKIICGIALFVPFQAFVLALILIPFEYPAWLAELLKRLGGTLIPLALVSVGYQLRLSAVRGKATALVTGLVFKLALAPALIFILFAGLLGTEGQAMRVTVFEAAMPPMIGASIVAMDHELDPPLLTLMLGVGIPLSFLTLPAWWYLLTLV